MGQDVNYIVSGLLHHAILTVGWDESFKLKRKPTQYLGFDVETPFIMKKVNGFSY